MICSEPLAIVFSVPLLVAGVEFAGEREDIVECPDG